MDQQSSWSSAWVPCPWQEIRNSLNTLLKTVCENHSGQQRTLGIHYRELWAFISTWGNVYTDFSPVHSPLCIQTFRAISAHSKCNTIYLKVITITHLIPPPTLSSLLNWNLANRILKKPSCSLRKELRCNTGCGVLSIYCNLFFVISGNNFCLF